MRKLAATLSLGVGLTATVPAIAQDPFTPIGPPSPPKAAAPADADPFAPAPTTATAPAPATDFEPTPPAPPAPVAAEEPDFEPAAGPGADLSSEPNSAPTAESVFTPDVPRPTSRVVPTSPADSAPAPSSFAPSTFTLPAASGQAASALAPATPPAQTEPPMPFGRFVPVYEPDAPRTADAGPDGSPSPSSLPAADYVLPPRPTKRHPADEIDPQARELIRQRELAVARQRIARIQYRKWQGISLLRPYVGDPTSRPAAPATPAQTIHFRSR